MVLGKNTGVLGRMLGSQASRNDPIQSAMDTNKNLAAIRDDEGFKQTGTKPRARLTSTSKQGKFTDELNQPTVYTTTQAPPIVTDAAGATLNVKELEAQGYDTSMIAGSASNIKMNMASGKLPDKQGIAILDSAGNVVNKSQDYETIEISDNEGNKKTIRVHAYLGRNETFADADRIYKSKADAAGKKAGYSQKQMDAWWLAGKSNAGTKQAGSNWKSLINNVKLQDEITDSVTTIGGTPLDNSITNLAKNIGEMNTIPLITVGTKGTRIQETVTPRDANINTGNTIKSSWNNVTQAKKNYNGIDYTGNDRVHLSMENMDGIAKEYPTLSGGFSTAKVEDDDTVFTTGVTVAEFVSYMSTNGHGNVLSDTEGNRDTAVKVLTDLGYITTASGTEDPEAYRQEALELYNKIVLRSYGTYLGGYGNDEIKILNDNFNMKAEARNTYANLKAERIEIADEYIQTDYVQKVLNNPNITLFNPDMAIETDIDGNTIDKNSPEYLDGVLDKLATFSNKKEMYAWSRANVLPYLTEDGIRTFNKLINGLSGKLRKIDKDIGILGTALGRLKPGKDNSNYKYNAKKYEETRGGLFGDTPAVGAGAIKYKDGAYEANNTVTTDKYNGVTKIQNYFISVEQPNIADAGVDDVSFITRLIPKLRGKNKDVIQKKLNLSDGEVSALLNVDTDKIKDLLDDARYVRDYQEPVIINPLEVKSTSLFKNKIPETFKGSGVPEKDESLFFDATRPLPKSFGTGITSDSILPDILKERPQQKE